MMENCIFIERIRAIDCPSEYFEDCESLAEIFFRIVQEIEDEVGHVMPQPAQDYLKRWLTDELDHLITHHHQPWMSEGIRGQLAREGIPVTVEDVLDTAFAGTNIGDLIAQFGPERAINRIDGFWPTDRADFGGYTPEQIIASWQRLGFVSNDYAFSGQKA